MENAQRNKNQKTALKAIEKSFLKRKDCIKKKTMELSILCDVKVCAIIIGPDGTIETWPESRNDVQRVIEMYVNCPVDKKKRQRPQELDHGGDDRSNKKWKVCVVSEGVKKTGFTDKDLLRRIDAKLCHVRKKIQLIKSNDQNTMDCTIDNPIETSFFQETASFDQRFEIPHLMVVGKEDIHELLTTAPTPKSLDPCSGLTHTYQDFQSSTLGVNSLTPGNELMDTFSTAYNEELNQFTPTDLNSFSPTSE
ncbi:unnamed protein product [Fraxinus pennsylvanica]|uniref:MADS-box domain-containing protein n=1 Tax=Fraxinus pennsylvanica TaxID=56036 RepID=A0AAD1ZSA3_9LAMI|nr:unnamed protein product [Fraxinus pennsylvanica]